MEIPDEAYAAMVTAMNAYGHNDEGMYASGLEAAAPRIARAAQVAILREVVTELKTSKWTSQDTFGDKVAEMVTLHIAQTIERRANELEGDAGLPND